MKESTSQWRPTTFLPVFLSSANPTDFVAAGSVFFLSSAVEPELPNENAGLESAILDVSFAAAVAPEPNEKPGFEAGVTDAACGVLEEEPKEKAGFEAGVADAAGVELEAVEPREKPGFDAGAVDAAGAVLEAVEPKENPGFEADAVEAAGVVLEALEPKEKAGLEVDVAEGVGFEGVDPKENPEVVSFFSVVAGVVAAGAAEDDVPKLNVGFGSSFFGSATAGLEPNENAGFCACDGIAFEPLLPNENVELDAGAGVGADVAGVVDEPKENGLGVVVAAAVADDGVLAGAAEFAVLPPNENGVEDDDAFPPKRDEPGAFCGAAFNDAAAPPNNDVDGAAELFRENEEGAAVLELEPKENGLGALLAEPVVASGLAPKVKPEEGVVVVAFDAGVLPKLNPPEGGFVVKVELDAEPKLKAGLLELSLFALPKREFELEPDPKEKVLLLPAVGNIVSMFV
ncbi:hypothetical protein PMKS-001985 [Pichia membranifaciens]|uniref:Uncharacterized protein n=1 Tax=Pichia membranifaciens TaxID=4926 RepID=A0A1Q2YG52_9ASCO|nr:hypothetical protein PMKS-001985 [Pichia membranifaciens]